MANCEKCGAEIEDGKKLCGACEAQAAAEPQPEAQVESQPETQETSESAK